MINFFDFDKIKKSIHKLNSNKKKIIIFLNPHSYVQIYSDKEYYNAVRNCTDIYIDGIGVYIYLKIKYFFSNKKFNYKKITGLEYFNFIIRNSYNKNFLLIGGTNEKLQIIKNRILIDNPSCKVFILPAPFVKNTFTQNHLKFIFKNFNFKNKIDYCFVSVGAPKQEKLTDLIHTEMIKKRILKVDKIISIGAVFDYYCREMSLLFYLSRRVSLEWFYRLMGNFKLWRRTFISGPIFMILTLFPTVPNYYNLRIIKNINKLISEKNSFILSAFNLASYVFIYNNKIIVDNDMYFWFDGVFIKFFSKKFIKLPGRKLISNLKLPKSIKNIHVIGNLSDLSKNFLFKKYRVAIRHSKLPFGNIEKILKFHPKIYSNELVLITLPTPKQEIFAKYISQKKKNIKIICIGGGLGIASGDEMACPKILDKIYLESIWRLKYQTKRRISRLVESLYLLFISYIFLFHKRIILDEKQK